MKNIRTIYTVALFLTFHLSFFTFCKVRSQTIIALHNFGNGTDGSGPWGTVTASPSGTQLFGMTSTGGTSGNGIIFSMDTDGTHYKVLANFNGTNGSYGEGDLLLVGKQLYGMTTSGGNVGNGNIFSIDTDGTNLKNLYSFTIAGALGYDQEPSGDLVLSGKQLFGTTTYQANAGSVFSIDTDGTNYKNLITFNGTNGDEPFFGGLVLSGKQLFGMTSEGGGSFPIFGNGTIFSIDTNGTAFKLLLTFPLASVTEGSYPEGQLILSGKQLFGATSSGGTNADGNLFSIDTDGTAFKNLFSFNGANGNAPMATLTRVGNTLYGTTAVGGTNNDGVAFSIDSNGSAATYTDLANFNGTNGKIPNGSLTLIGHTWFGMTLQGGTYGGGVVFKIGGVPIPLPITLTSFTANYIERDNNVLTQWTVATQVNNKLFTVERSHDGGEWIAVGTLPGAGNSSESLTYSLADNNPIPGTSYYRLKQTDYDGHETTFNTVAVNITANQNTMHLYPNPVGLTATLNYNSVSGKSLAVTITDIAGRTISVQEVNTIQQGENSISIGASSLTAGIYFLTANNGIDKPLMIKFVKE